VPATASPTPLDGLPAPPDAVAHLIEVLAGRRVLALTGAGMSTDSGIPDYRGPNSPRRNPMTYQQFTGSTEFRRHYWARNHIGWRHLDTREPNRGHLLLAELERCGVVETLLTQNVDRLHSKAGQRSVIDLHGRYDRVLCLECGDTTSRAALAHRLDELNPGFHRTVSPGVEIAPDADAVVSATAHFRMADCAACGGTLKPDIVFFGESVPKERVAAAFEQLDRACALLVLGSSLTVMSGLRFVRKAAKDGKPVVIVNRGATRGDALAAVKIDAGCADVLAVAARALA
jgi:NAD-dependent SIR2 family protein deacetylase